MTHAEIADIVRQLSYKPGTTFTFEEDCGHAYIRIQLSLIDAEYGDGRKTTLSDTVCFRSQPTHEREVLDAVLATIRGMEEHETDEWFCVDHEQVNPPHDYDDDRPDFT